MCLDLECFSPEDARGFSLAGICGGAGTRCEVSTLSLAAIAVVFPGEVSVKNRGTDGMKGECSAACREARLILPCGFHGSSGSSLPRGQGSLPVWAVVTS